MKEIAAMSDEQHDRLGHGRMMGLVVVVVSDSIPLLYYRSIVVVVRTRPYRQNRWLCCRTLLSTTTTAAERIQTLHPIQTVRHPRCRLVVIVPERWVRRRNVVVVAVMFSAVSMVVVVVVVVITITGRIGRIASDCLPGSFAGVGGGSIVKASLPCQTQQQYVRFHRQQQHPNAHRTEDFAGATVVCR